MAPFLHHRIRILGIAAVLYTFQPLWGQSKDANPTTTPKVTTEVSSKTPGIGQDWPYFLGPTRDSKSTERGILTDWRQGLKCLWRRRLGTSYGIGSVAQGRYFSFERAGDVERLLCLDARTGTEYWRLDQPVSYQDIYGYNNGPRSSPTVDDDRVYTHGVAGRLCCVSVADGKLLWSRDLNEEYHVVPNFFGVSSCPLVLGDLVIVMVGGSPKEDLATPPGQLDRVSPDGTGLVAFDKLTGKERWRAADELASYSSPTTIKLNDKTFVLALMRGGLIGVDPHDGSLLMQYPFRARLLESVNAAVPVVHGNQVLISECYQIGSALLDLSSRDPKVLRRDPESRREQSMRAHWTTPIEVDGYVYGCNGRNEPDSDLRCIRWDTGEVMWSDPRRVRSSLLYIDGHFLVLDEYGRLQLIQANPKKLEVVSEMELSEPSERNGGVAFRPPCWAAPIVSHGLLYVRGGSEMACYELIPQAAR